MSQRTGTVLLAIAALAWTGAAMAETATTNLAGRLCAAYEKLDTVSCRIRKTSNGVRVLSRVFYQQPRHIHVENVTPTHRRIIADGERLYYYQDGAKRGFSRPVDELTGEWRMALLNVPGTAMRHLLKLRGLPETQLEATDTCPIRRAYTLDDRYVVLSCDAQQRLVKVQYYRATEHDRLVAETEFTDFVKVADDTWIPRRHDGVVTLPDGTTLKETSLIDNLVINGDIASRLFDHTAFFPGIEFTAEFQNTYE